MCIKLSQFLTIQFIFLLCASTGCSSVSASGKPNTDTSLCAQLGGRAKKLALLVGVDNFKNVNSLHGCVNDVEDMKDLLIKDFGFDDADIKVLTNEKATYSAVLDAFQALIDGIGEHERDAQVVIHFSTHGSEVKDVTHTKPSGLNQTLVVYDSEIDGKKQIVDKQIYGLTLQLAKKTDHVVLIFDSCHSGNAARALGLGLARTPNPKMRGDAPDVNPKFFTVPDSGPDPRRYVLISGCLATELSYEVTNSGKERGALTSRLTQAIRAARRERATYRSIMDQVKSLVLINNPNQHAQLEGPNAEDELFGVGSRHGDYISAFVDGARIRLESGSSAGITIGSEYNLFTAGTGDLDPTKAIAQLRVTEVGPYISFADVIKSSESVTNIPPATALRAVETKHNYILGKIPLLIAPQAGQPIPNILKEARETIEKDPVVGSYFETKSEGAAQLILSSNGKKIILRRPDSGENVVASIDTAEAGWTKKLIDTLQAWGRWINVKQLANPDSNLEVTLTLEPAKGREVVATTRPADFNLTGGENAGAGGPSFTVNNGEQITMSVTNHADHDLFMYLFNIEDDGTVSQIYPNLGVNAMIKTGGTWRPDSVRASVLQGRSRTSEEVMLLVTEKPVDTHPLLLSKSKAIPGADALDLLLEQAGLNEKRLNISSKAGGWLTIHREYLIVDRNAVKK